MLFLGCVLPPTSCFQNNFRFFAGIVMDSWQTKRNKQKERKKIMAVYRGLIVERSVAT